MTKRAIPKKLWAACVTAKGPVFDQPRLAHSDGGDGFYFTVENGKGRGFEVTKLGEDITKLTAVFASKDKAEVARWLSGAKAAHQIIVNTIIRQSDG